MKKLFFLSLSIGLFSVSFSQTKTAPKAATPAVKAAAPKTATAAKPVAKAAPTTKSAIVLKTAEDSMSYSIGVLDGNFFKSQGIEKINSAVLAAGFSDALKGKPLFTPEQCDMIVRTAMQKNVRKKIQPAIDAGLKFLAENAKKPGVKQTPTGLQYEVITEGTGPKPADTSVVKVHYEGFLLNGNGRPFDSSRERGEPTQFPLNQVIRGWTEGVQLMSVGSKYKFYIPYQLAYGEQGSGEAIPGGSLLIFEVELIDIVKGQN
jgi:FKBP-type peptidyl-prolyl cis-trans isomerase